MLLPLHIPAFKKSDFRLLGVLILSSLVGRIMLSVVQQEGLRPLLQSPGAKAVYLFVGWELCW